MSYLQTFHPQMHYNKNHNNSINYHSKCHEISLFGLANNTPWIISSWRITAQIGKFMGPTWVLSAPDEPHVGPMNLAIRSSKLWTRMNPRLEVQLMWIMHFLTVFISRRKIINKLSAGRFSTSIYLILTYFRCYDFVTTEDFWKGSLQSHFF